MNATTMTRARALVALLAAMVLGVATMVLAPVSASAEAIPPPTGNVVLDPAFTGGVDYMVGSMARQSDGKIVTYGRNFDTWETALTRVTAAGEPDPTFSAPTIASESGDVRITAQPDDKLVITGDFTAVNGVARPGVARLNANGTLDTGFVPTVPSTQGFKGAGQAAVQPDGQIVLSITPGTPVGIPPTTLQLVRLSATGAQDPNIVVQLTRSFGGYFPPAIVVQPDGKLLIGGDFTHIDGVGRNGIARLTPTGGIDPSFNPGVGFGGEPCPGCPPVRPGFGVRTLALQPDGKVLVGGKFTLFDWFPANQLVRLNPDGRRDITFDSGTGVSVFAEASPLPAPTQRQSGGGSPSADLSPQTYPQLKSINAIALQPDGKAVVGGLFESYRGTQSAGVARVNANGSVDLGFDVGAGFYGGVPLDPWRGGAVFGLAVLPGGGILAAGSFVLFDQQPVANLAVLKVGPSQQPAGFTPLPTPVRIFDSREGAGPISGPESLDATGGGAVALPPDTSAIAVNLTVTGQTSSGFATISRDDGRTYTGMCPSSAVNWTGPGQTISNAVVTGISTSQKVKVCVRGAGPAHVIVDVTGYFAPSGGALFVPVTPARAYDSRTADGPLAGGAHRSIDLNAATPGTLPSGATGVAYNLTVTGPTTSGYLAVAPGGAAEPATSAINWIGAKQTIANAAQVGVSENTIEVFAGGVGSTHFVVDVVGYFVPAGALPAHTDGQLFVPIPPSRAYDSRDRNGPIMGHPSGSLGLSRTTPINLGGALPEESRAIAANVTVTGTVNSGYLTTSSYFSPVPSTSALNWMRTGTTIANASLTGTSPTGTIAVWAGGNTSTHYLVDVYGYFVPVD